MTTTEIKTEIADYRSARRERAYQEAESISLYSTYVDIDPLFCKHPCGANRIAGGRARQGRRDWSNGSPTRKPAILIWNPKHFVCKLGEKHDGKETF